MKPYTKLSPRHRRLIFAALGAALALGPASVASGAGASTPADHSKSPMTTCVTLTPDAGHYVGDQSTEAKGNFQSRLVEIEAGVDGPGPGLVSEWVSNSPKPGDVLKPDFVWAGDRVEGPLTDVTFADVDSEHSKGVRATHGIEIDPSKAKNSETLPADSVCEHTIYDRPGSN